MDKNYSALNMQILKMVNNGDLSDFIDVEKSVAVEKHIFKKTFIYLYPLFFL